MKKKYLEWIFYSVFILTISVIISMFIVSGAENNAWTLDFTDEYESSEDFYSDDVSDIDSPDNNFSDNDETTTVTNIETTTMLVTEPTLNTETTTKVLAETTIKNNITTEKVVEKETILISVSDHAVVNTASNCVTVFTAKNNRADFLNLFRNKNAEIYTPDGYELDDDVFVGTGCVVRIFNDGRYIEYTVIVKYDLDGNGRITANDARETLRSAVMLTVLSENQSVAGDVNNDKIITASDARKVLRKAAGLD